MQRCTPGQFCYTEQVWAAQDESGVSAAMDITEDDTPLSIWSILFQLLKHLAGKH